MKIIKKGTTIKQIKKVFRLCNKYNIKTTANLLIGLPHNQSYSKQIQLLDFIRQISLTTINTNVLGSFPGCELFNEAVENGAVTFEEWKEFAKTASLDFRLPGWNNGMTKHEQLEINSYINRVFYSRFNYLVTRIFETRSLHEFKIKAKIALHVLFLNKTKRTKKSVVRPAKTEA